MNPANAEVLDVLSEILVTIRGIASEASGGLHGLPGHPYAGDPLKACQAICSLAEAAHALPAALQPNGPRFLLEDALRRSREECQGLRTAFKANEPTDY